MRFNNLPQIAIEEIADFTQQSALSVTCTTFWNYIGGRFFVPPGSENMLTWEEWCHAPFPHNKKNLRLVKLRWGEKEGRVLAWEKLLDSLQNAKPPINLHTLYLNLSAILDVHTNRHTPDDARRLGTVLRSVWSLTDLSIDMLISPTLLPILQDEEQEKRHYGHSKALSTHSGKSATPSNAVSTAVISTSTTATGASGGHVVLATVLKRPSVAEEDEQRAWRDAYTFWWCEALKSKPLLTKLELCLPTCGDHSVCNGLVVALQEQRHHHRLRHLTLYLEGAFWCLPVVQNGLRDTTILMQLHSLTLILDGNQTFDQKTLDELASALSMRCPPHLRTLALDFSRTTGIDWSLMTIGTTAGKDEKETEDEEEEDGGRKKSMDAGAEANLDASEADKADGDNENEANEASPPASRGTHGPFESLMKALSFRCLPKLTHFSLKLTHTNIGDAGLLFLLENCRCKYLESVTLELSFTKVTNLTAIVLAMEGMPLLKHLSLSAWDLELTANQIPPLQDAFLQSTQNLQALTLNTDNTNPAIAGLINQMRRELRANIPSLI
eukprot:TRINITY_DN62063_c0_g1_i3.p1 TRINITY_DN62063_c0_g1~~TRINITY_DN62063_c0_g1_i3.p1  ORF type:complete len:554 (-),score=45.80 TRINITY_DN62063_c0_g1_i3:264-1925(-)